MADLNRRQAKAVKTSLETVLKLRAGVLELKPSDDDAEYGEAVEEFIRAQNAFDEAFKKAEAVLYDKRL